MNDFAHRFKPEFVIPWSSRSAATFRARPAERVRHPYDVIGRLGWKRALDIVISLVGLAIASR
jgi:hypothetical protein